MVHLIKILKAGKTRYDSGLKLQKYVVDLMKQNVNSSSNTSLDGILILTEHYPVYTIGIRSKDYDKNYGKTLQRLGADYYETNRGGLITFHGPGQLVAYPILNLTKFEPSVRWYVLQLEDAVISTCKQFNLHGYRSPYTGVWVNDKKICAMGIHVSQHLTSHGLALNCNTDLKWFEHIIPCGIVGKGVTSLSNECKRNISIEDTTDIFIKCFTNQFDSHAENFSDDFVKNVMKKINAS